MNTGWPLLSPESAPKRRTPDVSGAGVPPIGEALELEKNVRFFIRSWCKRVSFFGKFLFGVLFLMSAHVQRPPSSIPSTTSRHRAERSRSKTGHAMATGSRKYRPCLICLTHG